MRNVQPTRRSWMQASVLIGIAMLAPAGVSAQAPAVAPEPTTVAAEGLPASGDEGAGRATQETTAALEHLRRAIAKGDRVSVTGIDGNTWHGRVVRVGADDVEIATYALEGTTGRRKLNLSIALKAIQSLERPRDSSRNGALIGAGVGAGFGLAMFAYAYAVDANEMDEWGAGYALGTAVTTGIGALVGWAIDAVHSKPHFVYRAEASQKTQVQVAPLVAHGRGLAVTVRF